MSGANSRLNPRHYLRVSIDQPAMGSVGASSHLELPTYRYGHSSTAAKDKVLQYIQQFGEPTEAWIKKDVQQNPKSR